MTAPSPASLLCPTCGAAADPSDRFCEGCGGDLPFTDSAAPTPAPAPDVDRPDPDAAFASDVTVDVVPGKPCASCGAPAGDIQDGYCGVCGMKQPAARDHIEVALDGAAAVTDRGRKHHRNEDAFALDVTAERVIAVVCDGVSSTVRPDDASEAAAGAALEVLRDAHPGDDVAGALLRAHTAAQEAVAAIDAAPQPDLGMPSCTFLAAVVSGAVVDVATLGDCRTFWFPMDATPEVLTEDDSWAAQQIAAGTLTADEAYDHPLAHTITRWLGRDADPSWRPRLVRLALPRAGRLVLCSDGLWNYAETATAVAAAAGTGDPLTVAQRLVAFANDCGGHDNITVIVVDVTAADHSKGPTP